MIKRESNTKSIVEDHRIKIDTENLQAEFLIRLCGYFKFSYSGFKTGIARGILLNFGGLKQEGQLS